MQFSPVCRILVQHYLELEPNCGFQPSNFWIYHNAHRLSVLAFGCWLSLICLLLGSLSLLQWRHAHDGHMVSRVMLLAVRRFDQQITSHDTFHADRWHVYRTYRTTQQFIYIRPAARTHPIGRKNFMWRAYIAIVFLPIRTRPPSKFWMRLTRSD